MDDFFLFKPLQNPGRMLQRLAYLVFVLVLVGGIVTGIVISADMGYGSWDAILLGIVCGIVGGLILATLTALPLKAFGIITEAHERILEKNQPIISKYQVTASTHSEL